MISPTKKSANFLFASIMLALTLATGHVAAAGMKETVSVVLDGAHEVPSNSSAASGNAMISIADDKSVSGNITTKGIEGTVAHIHEGALGKSGPPIITLSKGEGGTWMVPAGSKLSDAQYASFKTGNLYVNVHSAAIPGGEIRGQLMPK